MGYDEAAVRKALVARKDEYIANLDSVTGKQVRRQLERDLGLESKALDTNKSQIDDLIHEVRRVSHWHVSMSKPAVFENN